MNVPRLCKCAVDDETAWNVNKHDVQILPRTVYPCSDKTNEDIVEVFPCPNGRNAKQRGLFLFGTATPTASPTTETRSPVTLRPTTLALSDEPKRAYRPKKKLPPTVAPRPTAAPTLSLPTVPPSSKPIKNPTWEPTEGRLFFTRAPSNAPSTPLPTDTTTAFPTTLVAEESQTDAPSAGIADRLPTPRPTRSPLPPLDGDELFAPTSDPVTFVPVGFDGDDVTNVPITDPSPSPTVLNAPTADIEERPNFNVPGTLTAAPSGPPIPEPNGTPSTPVALPTNPPFGFGGRVTAAPSEPPTPEPTGSPTSVPTRSPDAAETLAPTEDPVPIFVGGVDESETDTPTVDPTASPTTLVTASPTTAPTHSTTSSPTEEPTDNPTSIPTVSETEEPTSAPTDSTASPTTAPIALPTYSPTGIPTAAQVSQSSGTPTTTPTALSSETPSLFPSEFPSIFPSSVGTDTWAPTLSQFPTGTTLPTLTAFPTLGGLRWEEFATEYAFQTNDAELFGSSLSLSDDGGIVTVGAFDYSDASAGTTSAGRVVRYDLSGSFSEVTGGDFANLGYQVSASGDGNRLITFDSNTGIFGVYEYSAETSSLQSVDSLEVGLYPGSVDFALSGDGQWLAVVGEDFNEETFETRILVSLYEFNDQTKKLLRFGDSELFGFNESEENWSFFDVSINSDGRVLAVSLVGIQEFTGDVRVYQRTPSSGLLQIGQPLVSEFLEDGFGQDVEVLLTPSGQIRLAFSVPYDDMVYVFTFENEDWAEVGTPLWALDFFDEASGSEWGFDMAFSDDGDVLVVGAPAYGDSNGIVQAFQFIDGDWWAVGPTLGGPTGSNFGEAVECSSDCAILAVGAPFDCEDAAACGGNVYMFRDSSLLVSD